MIELLETYPVVIEVPVAWGEMDSFGHVNNIVYFRYFESARMAYLAAIEFTGATGTGPILASTQCRFRMPLEYPDTVRVGARVTELGADRFTMHYRVVSMQHAAVAAEGTGLVVAYDYGTSSKIPVPDPVRRRIEELEGGSSGARAGSAAGA
jgi:acyl-CoA thioester hydrolase